MPTFGWWQVRSAKAWSQVASVAVIAIGCFVVVGWVFDNTFLKSILPGLATMKFNTALAFILTGIALWIVNNEQADQRSRRLLQICALAVFLIGILSLSEYLLGLNWGIDQLVFKDIGSSADIEFPGRMAQSLAFCFTVVGAVLWLRTGSQRYVLMQLVALLVAFIGLLALAGYLYGVEELYDVYAFTSMSLQSTFALLFVSIGLLLAYPDHGPVAILASERAGGVMARRLLPAVIVLPLFFGWLRIKGQQAGLYGTEFGLALFALSSIVTFSALIWWNARSLNRVAAERERAAAHIRKLNRVLTLLSDTNQAIVRIRDRQILFEHVCRTAVEQGNFRLAWLGLLDPDSNRLHLVAQTGLDQAGLATLERNMEGKAQGVWPAGDSLRSGEVVIYNDVEADPRLAVWRDNARRLDLRALAVFPLKIAGEVRGVFNLYSAERGFFDEEELKLLNEMAQDISFAIEFSEREAQRQRAEEGLKRYGQRLEILHQIDLGLIKGDSIQALIEGTLKHLKQLIPCQRASISVIDPVSGDGLILALDLKGDTALGQGLRVPMPPDAFEGYDARHLRVFSDFRLMPDSHLQIKPLLAEGLRSGLNVLLMDQDRPIGGLGLVADTPNFFGPEYQEIAVQIASQLSIAIRQLHLTEALAQYTTDLEQKIAERTTELQAAKDRVEAILNNSLDGILLVRSDLHIEHVNAAFNRMLACEKEDYLDRSIVDLVQPDEVNQVTAAIQTAIREPAGKQIEVQGRRKDGTTFDAEISIVYTNAGDNSAENFVCAIRDISERKQSAAILEQQRSFLRSVIDFSPNTIFVKDYDARFVLANRLTAQLYNTTVDNLIGKSDADFNPSASEIEHFLESDRRVIDSGEPLFLEESITNFSGETRWLETTKVPILGIDGTKYVLGVSTDITERRRAEIALREQHEFLGQVINNVPELIMVKDRAGRFQLVNRRDAEVHGSTAADMMGKTNADFNPNRAETDFFAQKDRETLETGQTIFIPEETVFGRYYQTTKIPLKNQDGEYDRLLVVASDITERKNAEEALRQALAKEKELGELKSRFISMASHEFRTPLATILATTETLSIYRLKMTEAQIEARFNKVREQVSHLKDIMEDVLQLAQMQARRAEFNPTLLDLDSLCRSVIDEFQSRPDMTHQFDYSCDEMLRAVRLDKKLMRQVISNLISNAIKYSPGGKTIMVRLSYADEVLTLLVRDEGIGIPDADLKHLFEPFHRADNVGAISGTGLGLTITKEAVELHGGTITVDSQVGLGTSFTISIPTIAEGATNHDEDTRD